MTALSEEAPGPGGSLVLLVELSRPGWTLEEPRIGLKLIVGAEPPSADPDTLRPRALEADVRGGG